MRTLVRSLTPAGEYSKTLVIPKMWLDQLGHPKRVRIIIGRKRLIIYPEDQESGGDDGKRQ